MAIILSSCATDPGSPEIVVQDLQMKIPAGEQVFKEELLTGEIAETKIEHLAYAGPTEQTISLSGEYVSMFLFVSGNGTLQADSWCTTWCLSPLPFR